LSRESRNFLLLVTLTRVNDLKEQDVKLKVVATLVYRFDHETPVIVAIEPARSPDQTILSDRLLIDQPAELIRDLDADTGVRRFRTVLSGQVSIQYQGTIDNGTRRLLHADARQHAWAELPAEVLPYLLPSRFCPSDNLMRFAQREFSDIEAGGAKVLAVVDWLQEHVDYVHASATRRPRRNRPSSTGRASAATSAISPSRSAGRSTCRPAPSASMPPISIRRTSTPSSRSISTDSGGWSIRPGWHRSKAWCASRRDATRPISPS
jgi:hypothetical protein